jgi:hypothetical protein
MGRDGLRHVSLILTGIGAVGLCGGGGDALRGRPLPHVRHLALTISERDRARGRVIKMPLPDPRGDGHLISHLVLGQVAEEIERQYAREQAVVFLEESGIDLDRIPAPTELNQDSPAVNYDVDHLI